MPATLPLQLVLDIVRAYIQRDFFDEDWSPCHHRIAPLCLVCKDFNDVVQPVLWSYLPPVAFEAYELFARDSSARHLFGHTRGIWGKYLRDTISRYDWASKEEGDEDDADDEDEDDEDEAQFDRIYRHLAHIEDIRLVSSWISMDKLARFAALRNLTLESHSLPDFTEIEHLVFPGLRTLSLVEIRTWDPWKVSGLLEASVTPALRPLFLSNIVIEHARHDESYWPAEVDLSRVSAVQLQPSETHGIPHDFWRPQGPFAPGCSVMLTADTTKNSFYFIIDECPSHFPAYFQLVVPPERGRQSSGSNFIRLTRDFAKYLDPDPADEADGFKVAFLPSYLRVRAVLDLSLWPYIKGLFSACQKGGVKVIFFRDTDETRGSISSAFLNYLEDPSVPDQNPLVVESNEPSHEVDAATLWTDSDREDEK
ncbi:hypothetical protein JCM10296v2_003205 [Rhodotorula toruloides]